MPVTAVRPTLASLRVWTPVPSTLATVPRCAAANRATAATAFFASAREVEFSRQNPDTYVLHRLYEYDDARDAAQFYVVDGPLADGFVLEANEYRVFVKPELSDPDM